MDIINTQGGIEIESEFKEMILHLKNGDLHSSVIMSPDAKDILSSIVNESGLTRELQIKSYPNKPKCSKKLLNEFSMDLGIFSGGDNESNEENTIEFNLNSTYTSKTMSTAQLSVMLELIRDSPITPKNKGMPPYNRNFRLGNEPFRRI